MAPPQIIKPARTPSLGDLARIHQRSNQIHRDTLHDRGIEFPRPGAPARDVKLEHGREARRAERDVEGDARPGHVGTVEGRVPGQEDAAEAEGGGGGEVDPAGEGLAVEGGVLCGHDGRGDEEGDAGVIDAGEALHEGLISDGVHGVPEGAADEAFAGGEEEDGGDGDVGGGAEGEGVREGVEVEGDGEDDEEAEEV